MYCSCQKFSVTGAQCVHLGGRGGGDERGLESSA